MSRESSLPQEVDDVGVCACRGAIPALPPQEAVHVLVPELLIVIISLGLVVQFLVCVLDNLEVFLISVPHCSVWTYGLVEVVGMISPCLVAVAASDPVRRGIPWDLEDIIVILFWNKASGRHV